MVILNEHIRFNINGLRKRLSQDIGELIRHSLEFYMKKEQIEKVADKVEKRIKNKLIEDHFVYLNMDDNLCTYKFKRGKHYGKYCCRKINTNLPPFSSKDYLCTRHSKIHIPKKRERNSIKILKIHEKSHINSSIFYDFHKKIYNKIYKKNFKKLRNRKIFSCNGGLINFGKIFKDIL